MLAAAVPSILLDLAGPVESLLRVSWLLERQQHRSKWRLSTWPSSSVTQLQLFTHFCFTPSRQLESRRLFTLFLDSQQASAWDDFWLTGMRAFLGDEIFVSEAGGVTGGDEEGVRVTQFLRDILKDESGLGDTEEVEPLLPTGDRVLAGVVLTGNVGVFEGRGRSPVQLGVQAADDGEEMDGLLLALGALAGVLWLLDTITENEEKHENQKENDAQSLDAHQGKSCLCHLICQEVGP